MGVVQFILVEVVQILEPTLTKINWFRILSPGTSTREAKGHDVPCDTVSRGLRGQNSRSICFREALRKGFYLGQLTQIQITFLLNIWPFFLGQRSTFFTLTQKSQIYEIAWRGEWGQLSKIKPVFFKASLNLGGSQNLDLSDQNELYQPPLYS